MTMKPLIVHVGLLYINEEDGPTRVLLCNINIIPRIISMTPKSLICNDWLQNHSPRKPYKITVI
jgi:hypothetical protein